MAIPPPRLPLKRPPGILEAKDEGIEAGRSPDTRWRHCKHRATENQLDREPFDIWDLYPEKADPPVDLSG